MAGVRHAAIGIGRKLAVRNKTQQELTVAATKIHRSIRSVSARPCRASLLTKGGRHCCYINRDSRDDGDGANWLASNISSIAAAAAPLYRLPPTPSLLVNFPLSINYQHYRQLRTQSSSRLASASDSDKTACFLHGPHQNLSTPSSPNQPK